MPSYSTRYNAAEKTLYIATNADADTLIDAADTSDWTRQLRAGKTDQGHPLTRLAIIFTSHEAAEYNRDSLAFLQIDTCLGSLDAPRPFDPNAPAPSFATKDDFGI
jgi:hypothetical protein